MLLRIMHSLAMTALALAWTAQAEPLLQPQREVPPVDGNSELGGIMLRLLVPSEAQAPRRIDVTVTRPNGRMLASRSLSGGLLELSGIAPGDYRVLIEASGYETAERFVRRSDFVGATLFLNVTLNPDRTADNPSSGLKPVVEADILSIPAKALRQLEKATQATDGGRLQKAIGHLDKAIRIHPQFHQAYNNRGALFLRMQDYPRAEADLRRALELRSDSSNAWRNLGWLLVTQGRYQEAVECLQKLVQLEPQDAWPQTFLGESLFQLQRYRQAAVHFRQALQLDPTAYVASYRLGAICLHLGDKQKALQHWRHFLRTNQGITDSSIESKVRQLERELHN